MTIKDQVHELAKTQAVQTEILERLDETMKELSHKLLGNGKPGLIQRVDRLEIYSKLKNTALWLLTTTCVGLLATYIGKNFL